MLRSYTNWAEFFDVELRGKIDIRELENLKEISQLEILVDLLPSKVGNPLSYASIAEDLEVSFHTAKKWVQILSAMYHCFTISPFGAPKIKAVKKEQKLYLFDWSIIPEKGFKLENLIACQLLKYCHFLEDTLGEKMELRFLRDTEKREIDFVVMKNNTPIMAVECKSGQKSLSPAVRYFSERTNIKKFYQVHTGDKDYQVSNKIRVLPFTTFCKEMNFP